MHEVYCPNFIIFQNSFGTYHVTYVLFAFQIRVGHFEPEEISLTGEGVFPRISLDLPRDTESDNFKELLETAQQNLANVEKINDDDSEVFPESAEVNWKEREREKLTLTHLSMSPANKNTRRKPPTFVTG